MIKITLSPVQIFAILYSVTFIIITGYIVIFARRKSAPREWKYEPTIRPLVFAVMAFLAIIYSRSVLVVPIACYVISLAIFYWCPNAWDINVKATEGCIPLEKDYED